MNKYERVQFNGTIYFTKPEWKKIKKAAKNIDIENETKTKIVKALALKGAELLPLYEKFMKELAK